MIGPLWPTHHLPPGLGDGPVQFPLQLLHGGGDGFLPREEAADAGGARPALRGVHRVSGAQAAHHRGEPLVRRGVMTLFPACNRQLESGRLDEVTVTTNGALLARYAAELAACGVRRINVLAGLAGSRALPRPDAARAARRGPRGGLRRTACRAEAADQRRCAGQASRPRVRRGCVAWCGSEGHDLGVHRGRCRRRDRTGAGRPLRCRSDEVRRRLRGTLDPAGDRLPTAGPARYVRVAETAAALGYHPYSHNFCRGVQPCPAHLHRTALSLPGPGRRGGPAGAAAGPGRATRRSSGPSWRRSARKPRGHDFDRGPYRGPGPRSSAS